MNAFNIAEFRLDLLPSSLSEQPLIERLGWTLLESVWQFAVVAMLLWLFQRLLARRSADDRTTCADALVAMDELRAAGPRLVLSAGGGSLPSRIQRLAGHASPQANVSNWWVAGLVAAILVLVVEFGAFLWTQSTVRTIDCTVSGPDGPIGSAKVTVTLSVSGKEEPTAPDLDAEKTLSETVHTTDAEGRCQIKIPAGLAKNPALRLAVCVEHLDYVQRSIGPVPVSDFAMQKIADNKAHWLYRQASRQAIARIRLRRGNRLAGRVLLPDGSPAVGAKVLTRTKYQAYSWKFHSPDDYSSSDSAITDEQGRFAVMADQQATLTVTMPGQAPLIVDDLQEYVSDPPNTFRLPRGFRPNGRVLTVDGKPIPGAVVVAKRDFEWNEFDMPVAFGRSCAADENGEYELPPLPAESYHFGVNSRVADASRIPEYNEAGSRTERPEIPTEPLSDVILDVRQKLGELDESPRLDFQAVETVTVTARVEFPSGQRPKGGRTVDLTVVGRMNGRRWSGISVTADDMGTARLIVPRGVQDVVIGTGLARHRRTPSGPVEIGKAIHLGTVTSDVSGLVVIRPQLSKLKVKLKLPEGLSREAARLKAHIHISAWHAKSGRLEHSADRQRVWLDGAVQSGSSEYRGTALPNEEIVLRVKMSAGQKETVLHEERLTLAPGEERLRTIEIAAR